MKIGNLFPYKLYLVISEKDCKGKNFLTVAEQAIKGGVDVIQLREKNIPDDLFLIKAKKLKTVTDKYNIPLIINDNLPVAMQVHAAGIHVGNNDISPVEIRRLWNRENTIVGYSIEYMEQLYNSNTAVSDYLALSPIFSTPTKEDTTTEWGMEGIIKVRMITSKPLVVIGRMDAHNAASVIDAGADCIAVVSAICSADNPKEAAMELINKINNEKV